jgi:uncharacterized protein YkwD
MLAKQDDLSWGRRTDRTVHKGLDDEKTVFKKPFAAPGRVIIRAIGADHSFYHGSDLSHNSTGVISHSVISSAPVKVKRKALSVLLILFIGAISLVACSNAKVSPKVDIQPLATDTRVPIVPGPTSQPQKTEDQTQPPPTRQNTSDNTTRPTATNGEPPPTALVGDPTPESAAPAVHQHIIQPGETLLGIAMEYGVSMAAIQLANGLGSSIDLIAGQTLSIPGSTQWLNESYFWTVHVVRSGETLVGLASAYDLTVDEILRVNAIADPALIHVEQHLVMPLAQLVMLNSPQPTATTAPTAAPAVAKAQAVPAAVEPETELAPAAAPPPSLPAGPADWPTYILARINQVRTEHGLNTLTLAPELNSAAQAHAEDCARRGWGSHVGSDGAVLKTRLERAGYPSRNWGENWVQALNAKRGFEWWYGEIPPNDPHRRNILSPYYAEIGIGIAQTTWGYIFVTDFGRR